MIFIFALVSVFDYSVGIKANLTYDDNIFSYSRRYLDDFMQGTDPERFPFETYDDLFTVYDFDLALRKKIFMRRTTTFRLDIKASSYFNNTEKDYQVLAGSVRQSFGKFAARFEYLFVPGFLVKYYREPGGRDYLACEFTEHLYTFKTTFAPGEKLLISLRLARESDDYIETFDVYDSKAIRAGAGLDAAFGVFEPAIDYEAKDSDAQGPVPDISFIQHRVEMNSLLRLKRPRLSKVWLGYVMKYRVYTTDLPPEDDTPHSGRQDIVHRFTSGLAFMLFTKLSWSVEYEREIGRSFSEIYTNIAEYKNYDKWSLTGGLYFEY